MDFTKAFNKWCVEEKIDYQDLAGKLNVNVRIITSFKSGFLEPNGPMVKKLRTLGFNKTFTPTITVSEVRDFMLGYTLTQHDFCDLVGISITSLTNFLVADKVSGNTREMLTKMRTFIDENTSRKEEPVVDTNSAKEPEVMQPEIVAVEPEFVFVEPEIVAEIVPEEVNEMVAEVVKSTNAEPLTFRNLIDFINKFELMDTPIRVGEKVVVGKKLVIDDDNPVLYLKTE